MESDRLQLSVCGLFLETRDDGVRVESEETGEGFTVPFTIVSLINEAMETVKRAAISTR